MRGQPRTAEQRLRLSTAQIAIAAAVAGAVYAAIVAWSVGDITALRRVADIGNGLAALVAAGACFWAARRSEGSFRRGWLLMSAAATAWLLGQMVWTFDQLWLRIALPFPSLPDAGFLAALVLIMAGVVAFWRTSGGRTSSLSSLVDGLVILVALIIISWIFGLREIFRVTDVPWKTAVGLTYPFGDTVVLTVLILSITRATRSQTGAMLLLLGGLGMTFIADAAFAYATTMDTGPRVAGVLNAAWGPGFLIIAVAAVWSARSPQRASERDVTLGWQLGLPAIAVWTAAGFTIITVARGSADSVLTLLGATMVALLAVSQLLAIRNAMARLIKSRQSEALLSEMVAHARRGIARTDKDFRIIDANPGLCQMFGEPRDAVIGAILTRYLPPDAQAVVFGKLGAMMRGELDTFEAQNRLQRADGTMLWVGASVYAVKNDAGQVDYALAYVEDLTAKHESEESSQRSLAVLENLNRVRSDFVRSISHEFKTALVGIKGFSELIRDVEQLDRGEAKAFAVDIYESADRLDRLVTELVEVNSVETSRITLSVEPVDLNLVITQEAARFRSEHPRFKLQVDLASAVPTVNGDVGKLSDVLHTLLENATAFSPDSSEIAVSSAVSLGEVMVNVRDPGAGNHDDLDNRLFGSGDIYANNPITRVVGTGLRLGIARQVVEMHGGHIWVEHLPRGAVTHFTVPAAAPPAAGLAADAQGRVA